MWEAEKNHARYKNSKFLFLKEVHKLFIQEVRLVFHISTWLYEPYSMFSISESPKNKTFFKLWLNKMKLALKNAALAWIGGFILC